MVLAWRTGGRTKSVEWKMSTGPVNHSTGMGRRRRCQRMVRARSERGTRRSLKLGALTGGVGAASMSEGGRSRREPGLLSRPARELSALGIRCSGMASDRASATRAATEGVRSRSAVQEKSHAWWGICWRRTASACLRGATMTVTPFRVRSSSNRATLPVRSPISRTFSLPESR